MEDKRVADYFLVVGRPEVDPGPLDELSNESNLKATHKLDPIVDIAIINRSFGEVAPSRYKCIEFTPTGFPADLNHGSIRAPEMYLCYRRGRDKPPLVDIGVLYDGKDTKERVLAGCEVLYNTVQGRSANVNNSGSTRIYVTYRRASPTAACDTLAVTDICVILQNKGEVAPHAYHTINKTLNKGMMGSDVYLCYKKSMTKTNVLAYKPAILSRYPVEDLTGVPLPERVPMFCLPLGATLECWPPDQQHPLPIFSTFILTAASGEKVYGAAVTFYEEQDKDKLDESQQRQLGLLDDANAGANADAGAEEAGVVMAVHQNKCICLLSHLPFFETFKKFLGFLYKTSKSGPHSVPLERYIAHFLNEVPLPSPQRPRILIQLPTTAISLSQPDATPLPKSGASFIELLKNLGPTNCITVLLFALMEQKLLIHSLRPAVLTSVAEAVANIMFPFHWQCPYIPLCPLALSYVLNSPTPFIVGIDSRYFDLYDPPSDVTCIDLDTNSLTISEDRKGQTLKMMPKKVVKVLKTTLERLYELLCQNPTVSGTSSQEWLEVDVGQSETDFSGWKKEMHMEMSIQEAFLRFMAVLLKGYNNFLLPIIKAPTIVTTDISNLFDIQGFLKSRDRAYHKFYVAMMKTQAFSRFIEERSFVSDKDTCLAFFDECVEKVDENGHDSRLIDLEDSLLSDRTVLVMPPEPTDLPEGVTYDYHGFPLLDMSLFPHVVPPVPSQAVSTLKASGGEPGLSSLCSPMTRRTKHELKSAQKFAMKHSNIPKMWAQCLVWHCYSLWFIHLPAYMKTVHSKTKALRVAYEVLGKAQSERLQPPDEVCYRVMMQLCGLYHQPVMAVKVLFEMKRNGVQPNAVTYGFYNKAVLESKWPTADTRGYQLWTRLRHVVIAVAQFKQSWHARRHSVYSNSESDLDGQSLDSFLETEPVGATIIKDAKTKNQGKRSRTGSETGAGHASAVANEERISTGGLSDRGYGSSTFEEGKRISLVLGSQNSLDLSGSMTTPANEQTPTGSNPSCTPLRDDGDCPTVTLQTEATEDSGTLDHANGVITGSSSCETVASSPLDLASTHEADVRCPNSTAETTTSDSVSDGTGFLLENVSRGSDAATVTANSGFNHSVEEHFESNGPLGVSETTMLEGLHALDVADLSSPDSNIDVEIGESQSSSIASPSHGLLVPVTENDPLGVFNNAPGQNETVDSAVADQEEEDLVTHLRLHYLDIQPFGWGGDLTSSGERTCGTINGIILPEDRVSSLETVESVVSSKKSKTSTRGDIFGNVMRSAATRLFSKYNDLRKSISTPGTRNDSGSLNSINSVGVEPVGATASSESNDTDRVSTDDSEVAVGVNGGDSAELTPPKSRLRVPGLYAPLASVWDGLKTLQTKETLQGLANSFEHMTTSVRDSLKETWSYSTEGKEEEAQRSGLEDRAGADAEAEDDLNDDSPHSCLSDLKGNSGQGDLDQLIPVEESSDRGSLTGDPSSFRFSSGSMLSLPQTSAPVEVEMCTLSKCQSCGNLLYDEEIMAGWTSDDSNLSTSCQFCGQGLVPLIHIYIRDYRHSVRSPMSNLSQSVESMLSVQSAPISANRKTTSDLLVDGDSCAGQQAPSGDDQNPSGRSRLATALETMQELSAEEVEEIDVTKIPQSDGGNEASGNLHVDENSSSSAGQTTEVAGSVPTGNDDTALKAETARDGAAELGDDSKVEIDENKAGEMAASESVGCVTEETHVSTRNEPSCGDPRVIQWCSKDLELGTRQRVDSGLLENRRCTSECSLDLLTPEMNVATKSSHSRRAKEAAVAAAEKTLSSGASLMSNGSDEKMALSGRKYMELDPITVPYLSPLVLRKELENVLDQDGDLCLSQSEFLDQHPIIYWNLVWYFRRLDVPSHMPGFILTAKSLNKSDVPIPSLWSSGDSRHVAITCMWDNVRQHQDHGPPMYIIWNQANGALPTTSTSSEVQEMFSKSVMINILNLIKKNDVISPLRLILKERSKRQMQTSKTRFHSIYRDLLFLSFTALGRENIDHEAFDREFKSMFLELPAHDSARLRTADRTPSSTALLCRKMFQELQLPVC